MLSERLDAIERIIRTKALVLCFIYYVILAIAVITYFYLEGNRIISTLLYFMFFFSSSGIIAMSLVISGIIDVKSAGFVGTFIPNIYCVLYFIPKIWAYILNGHVVPIPDIMFFAISSMFGIIIFLFSTDYHFIDEVMNRARK